MPYLKGFLKEFRAEVHRKKYASTGRTGALAKRLLQSKVKRNAAAA